MSVDSIGTEQRTTAGIQKSLSYTYNLDNSVATLKYPSGAVITYTPDSAGRMLSAVDGGNNINYITSATYDAGSSLTGFVSGSSGGFSGITNSWQYNPRLQICRITALTSGTSPASCTDSTHSGNVLDLGYNLNLGNGDNGNVIGITNYKDSTRSQSFAVACPRGELASRRNTLNRLTSAQNAGTNCSATTLNGGTEYWGNSYGFDPWGNLLQKNVTKCKAESLTVTSDTSNHIHWSGSPDYGYDSAGNMTYDATTTNTYSYDAENRITGAAGYTYTYDVDGNRVEKSNGSSGTIYWYMSPGIVAESDLSGNLKSEYVFFDGERVARKDFSGGTTSVSYYFSDHLKTASVITNSSGAITEDEDYYPWGGELPFVNSDSNHYKFGSHERDSETGLDYLGARYYGNWTGRFLTPDWAAKPITVPYANFGNPQTLNLYTYGKNNPTTVGDQDGHFAGQDDRKKKAEQQKQQQQQQQPEYHTMWYYMFHPNTSGATGEKAKCDDACYNSWMAFHQMTSAVGGAYAATAVGTSTENAAASSAQQALDSAVANRTGNPGAMVAAYDKTTGSVAVGSSGPLSRLGAINPELAAAAEKAGGVGATNPGSAPVGCCAEFEAFNKLMNEGLSMTTSTSPTPFVPELAKPWKCASRADRCSATKSNDRRSRKSGFLTPYAVRAT